MSVLPVEPLGFARDWLLQLPGVAPVAGDRVGPDLIGEDAAIRLASLGAIRPPTSASGESVPRVQVECWAPRGAQQAKAWELCAAVVAGAPTGAPWTRLRDGAHLSDVYVSAEPTKDADRETGRHRWLLAVTMTLHPVAPA